MNRQHNEDFFRPDRFVRVDNTKDEEFYRQPRLVTHIDDKAIAAATKLYRELLPSNGAILDLMSSWVSHLPGDVQYSRVSGLGMNEEELRANPQLTDYIVHNLNANPRLPYGDGEFDGVVCTVSVQYLTQPQVVFREVGRVLKPGAPFIVTFSNRCFPTKAVAIWRDCDDGQHLALVVLYFKEAGNWERIAAEDRSPGGWFNDPLYAVYAFRKSSEQ